MTLSQSINWDNSKANGVFDEIKEENAQKRLAEMKERRAKKWFRDNAKVNRAARHKKGSGAFKGDWKPSKGTRITVVTTPTSKVTKTGEIVKNDVSKNIKRKKMSNAEFENNRDHCEKKSKTECSGCKGFRQAAYQYFSGGKEGKHPSRDDHKCLVHRA